MTRCSVVVLAEGYTDSQQVPCDVDHMRANYLVLENLDVTTMPLGRDLQFLPVVMANAMLRLKCVTCVGANAATARSSRIVDPTHVRLFSVCCHTKCD